MDRRYTTAPMRPDDPTAGEVRLSALAARVARRWYIVALCVAVAVLLVVLRGLGGAHSSQASTTVYLGQPLGLGQSVIANAPSTNVSAAVSFVTSSDALSNAAKASGLTREQLAANVAARGLTTGSSKVPTGPYVLISLAGPFSKARSAVAVRSLASQLITHVGDFHRAKVKLLDARITAEKRQLKSLETATRQAQQALNAINRSSLSEVDKTIGAGNWVAVLQSLSSQVTTVSSALSDDQLELAASRDVERPGYLSPVSASRQTPTTRKTSYLVAAFVGLAVGILLALAWDTLRSSPRESAVPLPS
jgi:hypothetical protein